MAALVVACDDDDPLVPGAVMSGTVEVRDELGATVSPEGVTATTALAPFHGGDLTAVDGETVSVLVLGGTENTFFRDGESDAPSALYPDLAPEGAVAVVEQ